MFRYILPAVFALATSVSFANSQAPSASEIKYSSVRNLPVIVKTEVVAQGKCRLHYENGTTMVISCNTQGKKIPEAVAKI